MLLRTLLWQDALATTIQRPHKPSSGVSSRHLVWNFTWMVLSDKKDPVWSISKLSNQIWWPDALTPNLCKIALSMGAPWGIEHPLDISMALEFPTRNPKPGCATQFDVPY